MRHFIRKIILAAALLSTATLPALADNDNRCGTIPRTEWIGVEDIARKATELGYQVSGVDEEDGCWEVEGRDRDGRRVDVYFQPVTGEVVHFDYDD